MADPRSKSSTKRRKPLSVWELPKLLQSVHSHRQGCVESPKERPHYPGILAFVYRNRFAVASQIQRRFSQYLKSDRTARRHLAEMQALGYLDVAPTNNTSPLWPKVYFVTRQGLIRLRKAYAEKGKSWKPYLADRKRSEGHSAQHVLHELFTTEFLLMVWETAQRRDDFELLKVERRSLVKHPAFRFGFAGKETRLEPDGMFLYRKNGSGMMCCFVEMDMGTMSQKQLQTKFQRYSVWSQSDEAKNFVESLYAKHSAKNPRMAFWILIIRPELIRVVQICLSIFHEENTELIPDNMKCRVWYTESDEGENGMGNRFEDWKWFDGDGNKRSFFSKRCDQDES